MMSIAAAPSVICDEFAAVTTPSSLNAGFSLASVSIDESGRMPSSAENSSSPLSVVTWIGTISRSKRPSERARAARLCDSTENSSLSSREMPHFSAISSAEMPCGTRCG